jgi:hypothetical protein
VNVFKSSKVILMSDWAIALPSINWKRNPFRTCIQPQLLLR